MTQIPTFLDFALSGHWATLFVLWFLAASLALVCGRI